MNEEHEREVLSLLDQALELEGEARLAFLDQACAGDDILRSKVEALLAVETGSLDELMALPEQGGGGEPSADFEVTRLLPNPAGAGRQPERLGHYRVLERLGHGGMGTVYLGEQVEPVQRRVALKVINAFHDPAHVERFALECQALARLSHPNIASLYEVGAIGDDRPFVAMELVEGSPITTWCDTRRATLKQRIELFFGVCAGVRHAHEKGILHRDLKPTNVLVTEIDGRPVAKVIDFGIARAFDEPRPDPRQRLTRAHQIVGSPVYMSPEAMIGQDADTRSDVYGLGVLLYELLSGVLPVDLKKESFAALLRRLGTRAVPSPLERFLELEEAERCRLAERRGLAEPVLMRRLRGDLGAIVCKAIAFEREERYGLPGELAADLERYLETRPVEARPQTLPYVGGLYLRRRAPIVAAVSALILTLGWGVVSSTREAGRANLEADRARKAVIQAQVEAERARRAQEEAQEVSRFLVDLFEGSDPERELGQPEDLEGVLERGAERLRGELENQPLARARLLHTVSDIYTKRGQFERAEALALEALALREDQLPADHGDVLQSVNQLGVVFRRQRRLEDAEPLLRRVLETRLADSHAEPLVVARAHNNLGNLLWNQGRLELAAEEHGKALALREKAAGPEDRNVGESLNNLGVLAQSRRRYGEAESYLLRADAILAKSVGERHAVRAAGLNNLGMVQHRLRKWTSAERHLGDALSIYRERYGPLHPRTAMASFNLAKLLFDAGREAEALPLFRDALASREQHGSSERALADALLYIGRSLGRLGELEEAEGCFERILSILEHPGEEVPRRVLTARSNLAWLQYLQGSFAAAEAEHRRLLSIREQTRGPDHTVTASTLHGLGLTVGAQGRDGEAQVLLERALAIYRADDGSRLEVGEISLDLGELARRGGRIEEARRWLRSAVDILRNKLPPGHRDIRRAEEALALLARGSAAPPIPATKGQSSASPRPADLTAGNQAG